MRVARIFDIRSAGKLSSPLRTTWFGVLRDVVPLTILAVRLARRKGLGYPATSQEVAAFFRRSSAQETVEILEWPALLLIFGLSKARRRSIPFDGSVTEEQRRSGQKAAQPFGPEAI
jgi:hypothetical protein